MSLTLANVNPESLRSESRCVTLLDIHFAALTASRRSKTSGKTSNASPDLPNKKQKRLVLSILLIVNSLGLSRIQVPGTAFRVVEVDRKRRHINST
jgi:hypothetical protein